MSHLHQEIDNLKLSLISLAATVEQSIRHAVRSIFDNDAELAESVISRDVEIDAAEVEIEEDCLRILALYQPVASDMRFIVTALKVNNELERIGDISKNIAQRVLDLHGCEPVRIPSMLEQITKRSEQMVRRSLDSLINLDVDLAKKVRMEDDEVDDLNREIFGYAQDNMRKTPDLIEGYVLLISISRGLERIADLATNIAEDVIYLVEGTIARHQPSFPEGKQ